MKLPFSALRQRGTVLWLFVLLLAFGSFSLLFGNRPHDNNQRQEAAALARSKEALIARAVNDINRPGSLPCPDLLTDSSGLKNHPGDGKADNLTRNDCPSYVGWLPWVTLDQQEPLDSSGSRLWYVLAPEFRDDDNAPQLNDETQGRLVLDGNPDLAALIIAPGKPLAGQQRRIPDGSSSRTPSDYLDQENGNADDHQYRSSPPSPSFNDRVLGITRQELISAVDQRIAGEIRRCLINHVQSISNPQRLSPWPAPLGGISDQGQAGSHFGRMPLTQPGPGPSQQLENLRPFLELPALLDAKSADTLARLQQLREATTATKALFEQIYNTSRQSHTLAGTLDAQLGRINQTILDASINTRISATERLNIRSQASTIPAMTQALLRHLEETGYDFFPNELTEHLQQLRNTLPPSRQASTQADLDTRLSAIAALRQFMAQSSTPNATITDALSAIDRTGSQAETALRQALLAPSDPMLTATADSVSIGLIALTATLPTIIQQQRINAGAQEIRGLRQALDGAYRLPANRHPELTQRLNETREFLEGIRTGANTLNMRLKAALDEVTSAESVSQTAATGNQALLSSNVLNQLDALASAIEQHGDNLTHSSLHTANQTFSNAQETFATYTAPTQREMVPYAETLRLTAVDLQFWTEIIQRQASKQASRAKANPDNGQLEPTSATNLATQTLTSLEGTNGSLMLVSKTNSQTASATDLRKTEEALSITRARLLQLQESTLQLAQIVHSSPATAFPTLWHGTSCQMLQDPASWWYRNGWGRSVFYQISKRTHATTGNIQINGKGDIPLLVITAGPPLSGQTRNTLLTSAYLEDANADASRDGLAHNPSPHFSRQALSKAFNDRLAY